MNAHVAEMIRRTEAAIAEETEICRTLPSREALKSVTSYLLTLTREERNAALKSWGYGTVQAHLTCRHAAQSAQRFINTYWHLRFR